MYHLTHCIYGHHFIFCSTRFAGWLIVASTCNLAQEEPTMRDHLHRSRAIRNALQHASPAQPQGNLARHLNTLAALISGIVGSQSTPLPNIAAPGPKGTKPESRGTRFARCFDNAPLLEEGSFLP
jgi:hypothetical protein